MTLVVGNSQQVKVLRVSFYLDFGKRNLKINGNK